MTGRPSSYTEEKGNAICERIALGESLTQICKTDGMPPKQTVLRWIVHFPSFHDQYARAREAQAEHFADEILDIADDGSNDYMKRQNGDGEEYEATNHEHIQRSRLRVDSRKWLMSKVAPKKYGDRQILAGDKDAPLVAPTINVTVGSEPPSSSETG